MTDVYYAVGGLVLGFIISYTFIRAKINDVTDELLDAIFIVLNKENRAIAKKVGDNYYMLMSKKLTHEEFSKLKENS